MITHHDVLEHGDFAQRQQVVRWVRRFPFSFISDREYIIAKRLFREGQDMYGITKSIDHARAPPAGDVVRMDVFYSMWRSRTVPCPWNSGQPACETVLLHHEQARAARHAGFCGACARMLHAHVRPRRHSRRPSPRALPRCAARR